MAEHSIMQSAKQGDPKAIAYLITHTLQKYGITARANRKGRCLKLLLEAEQVPHQATMIKVITQGMRKLNVESLQMVKVYGRKLGQPTPAWRHVVELIPFFQSIDLITNPSEDSSQLFQLNDLDPDAMILLPLDPQVQMDDLDPEALILFPLEPASPEWAPNLVPNSVSTSASTPTSIPISAPTPISPDLASDLTPDATNLDVGLNVGLNSNLDAASNPYLEFSLATLPPKLPKRLTLLLLCLLWIWLLINTLTLIYSLLWAGSGSLYAGLDLSNTNQPFASLLAGVVSIAEFIVTPFHQASLWITLAIVCLSLIWLHRMHASLKGLFGDYPISPDGAVARFATPLLNLWGMSSTLLTLARYLSQFNLDLPSQIIRQLTVWFYLSLLLAFSMTMLIPVGLRVISLGLFDGLSPTLIALSTTIVTSTWYAVARDAVIWVLSLVWLRLVRTIWRAVRQVYRDITAPFRPARLEKPVNQPGWLDLRAILLGGGTSLLSLILFNCLLWLIAAVVFISNDLRPEAIVPTFYDSESLLILVLVGSSLCIGLGGFLTAQTAHRGPIFHTFGLGIFLTMMGFTLQRLLSIWATVELPFWFETASAALIIPSALIGGGLCQWLRSL
jgi:hypothetical protein